MNIEHENLNHELLKPYKDELIKSALPSVPFTYQMGKTKLWESKLGGTMYLPKNAEYPTNKDGIKGTFLAQVNFAEMPKLQDFPESGILQFFVCEWGYDEPESYVYYYPEVLTDEALLESEVEKIADYENSMPYGLDFEAKIIFKDIELQVVTLDENNIVEIDYDDNKKWDTYYELMEHEETADHRLGGYGVYAQDCNRDNPDDVLLFQLISELREEWDICWGDAGTAHYFINREDLKNKRFDQVYFRADCH